MQNLLLSLLLFGSIATHAQTNLSLTQALELGLKNRYDLQADALNLSLAVNTVQKTRNAWLPTVTASGNVRYNTQLQKTVLPAGAFGNAEAQRLAFGTRNSTVLSLDLTQPLYRPEHKTDLAIGQNTFQLERERHTQQQTNAKVGIAEAYLNVLLRELQRSVAQSDAARNQTYFELSEGKHRLGTLPEADFLNARLQTETSRQSAQTAEQNYRQAQATLCYRLNIPTDTTLVLTDRIENQSLTDDLSQSEGAVLNRTELRQSQLQQEGFALQSRRVQEGLKPTVSLYGNYSAQFLANDFNYVGQPWNPFNYVGLQVSVPLSARLTRRTNQQTYQLQARQTELRRQQTETDIAHELRQARTDFNNARTNLQSTRTSLDVARQLSELQQAQYRLGTRLYSQVLDAEKSVQAAQQSYLEAAYAFLVARLNYEKALGKY
ncbi:MAG: TolC family protein [Cytophagales bacterium]|nr:MAG: TolC family protein [Cytophagales bacterium]